MFNLGDMCSFRSFGWVLSRIGRIFKFFGSVFIGLGSHSSTPGLWIFNELGWTSSTVTTVKFPSSGQFKSIRKLVLSRITFRSTLVKWDGSFLRKCEKLCRKPGTVLYRPVLSRNAKIQSKSSKVIKINFYNQIKLKSLTFS